MMERGYYIRKGGSFSDKQGNLYRPGDDFPADHPEFARAASQLMFRVSAKEAGKPEDPEAPAPIEEEIIEGVTFDIEDEELL